MLCKFGHFLARTRRPFICKSMHIPLNMQQQFDTGIKTDNTYAPVYIESILVNRGWIPQSMRPKEKRQSSMINSEIELVGVVRLTEKRAPFMPKNHPEKGSWFYRDLGQMSVHFGSIPVWLDARGIPDPPAGWPIPNQTRVTLRNEHFSYLVTWYMLSAFTALMWHRYFIKKLPLL